MLARLVALGRALAAIGLGILGLSVLILAATVDRHTWTLASVGLGLLAAAWFAWPRNRPDWRLDPATARQISFARDLGIQVGRGMTKGEISDLITQATRR
jgi:uncharacterized membrane protein YqjE